LPKTDEQFFKDRLELFESEGWLDLMTELETIEDNTRDIETINDEKTLWEAKGQLKVLGYLLSLESATQIAVEQSNNIDSTH
jgi:hypothetical protein